MMKNLKGKLRKHSHLPLQQKGMKNTYREGVQNTFIFGHFCLGQFSSMEMSCSMSEDMVLLSNFAGLMTNMKGHIKEWKTGQVTTIGHLQPGTLYTDMQVVLCAKVSGKRCE